MYQRALVPTDGSDLSRVALPHVARVATSAVVFRVPLDVEELLSSGPEQVDLDRESSERWREAELARVRQDLGNVADQLQTAGLSEVTTAVGEGHAGEAIVRAAKEHACDVIVMATHGRTGIRRAMLGSVAGYVANHAEGSAVLLVRE